MALPTQPPYQFKEGACLLFDKPKDWTSFQLVKKIKYTTKAKTGHAGTLDPLATGLMILCTGKFTKKIEQLQGLDKTYTGRFKIGVTTPSYDGETAEENEQNITPITEQQLMDVAKSFLGQQEQIPPMYSALKQNGKKLYDLARQGKTVERKPRKIDITAFELTDIALPFVSFKISCSKGTYIRSIAHDFGQKLGVGAYLYELRRTRIGPYHIEDAWTIDDFVSSITQITDDSL